MPSNVNKSSIANVDFYGEQLSWPLSDLLHCEPLENRSKKHNWAINAHRHNQISQFFFVETGSGYASIDGKKWHIKAPCLLFIPIGVVHGFEWQPDSTGTVISLAHHLMARFSHTFKIAATALHVPQLIDDKSDMQNIHGHCQAISREYNRRQVRQELLHSMVFTLLNLTADSSSSEHTAQHANRHIGQFNDLLEQHFFQEHRVEWYASTIGINPVYLNSLCKKNWGLSAQQLIHQRLIHEAKRLLTYTVRPNSSIAIDLGFNDPSYFNRFFKRHCQVTPKEFRRRSGL